MIAGSERAKNRAGRGPRPESDPARRVLQKTRRAVEKNVCGAVVLRLAVASGVLVSLSDRNKPPSDENRGVSFGRRGESRPRGRARQTRGDVYATGGYSLQLYGLLATIRAAELLISICALTFCRPTVSFSTCFSNSCTLRCSLRNSLSNIALICS